MSDLFERPAVRSAAFSDCRRYRYTLEIIWDASRQKLVIIMLNPSTADEIRNDPTVERMERRARMLGFGGVIVLNLFAFRATDPRDMKRQQDPVGDMNDQFIRQHLEAALASGGTVFVGWGAHGTYAGRAGQVAAMMASIGVSPVCLAVTNSGQPVHPLYQPYEAPFRPWSAPR